MKIPENLKYSKTHEWVRELGDGVIEIGITDYAQNAMGSIVFVNLPEAEDDVAAGEAFGDVESVKAVSDVISPVTGLVCEINEELLDHPEMINESPYEAWLIRARDITAGETMLDAEQYADYCAQEAK